jgi:protein phosphatase PTC7
MFARQFRIQATQRRVIEVRHYTKALLRGARHYFRFNEPEVELEDTTSPYIQYPLVTKEQMKKITNDKFKFEFAHKSFAHHSQTTIPTIHSLSDLTVPSELNSLLPRRRPQGSPADTLSIKAGDDAMLVSPTIMAIADGVSGWESKGEHCSSGIWARSMVETLSRLMTEYKLSHTPHHLNKRDIDQVLDDSYLHTSHLMDLQKLRGSSTLILAMLSGEYLKMISIGDSKMYIIRNGEIIKTNEEQMVSDLCPQQIGTQTLTQLPSDMAWVDSIKLQADDLIVMCSDGISDNLYEWELVHYVNEFLNEKKDNLKAVASKLLIKAKEVAWDDYAYTPYNEKVNSLPKKYGNNTSKGGKLDDMSLCIAKVVKN